MACDLKISDELAVFDEKNVYGGNREKSAHLALADIFNILAYDLEISDDLRFLREKNA